MEAEMWKDIRADLQEPEVDLAFRVPVHKTSTLPGNQEANVLAKILTLATDPPVDAAGRVDWRSGRSSASRRGRG